MRAQLVLFFLIGFLLCAAQALAMKGVPPLINYAPQDYQNKGKIWDISSAPNGIMYYAADRGLLEFDGKTWNCFQGSDGFTRSLLILNDSVIYTGSDQDFGIWKRKADLSFEYTSLYPFREEPHDIIEEFWDLHLFQGDILFVSSQNIFVLKNEQFVMIAAPTKFSGSFILQDTLYIADDTEGLFTLHNYSLEQVFSYPANQNLQIAGLFKDKTGLTIVTRDAGLLSYAQGTLKALNNSLSDKLREAKVFSFKQMDTSSLAYGTVLKGLLITDLNGQILHNINRHKGLPNNTILSLYASRDGKLWLGMDYGLSVLDMKSHLTHFFDYRGDFGTGYTAALNEDVFFLGTNQGLYHTDWPALDNRMEFFQFQLIPQTEGQVWTLTSIDNTLFMCHDKGLFIVDKNRVEKVGEQSGVWTIIPYQDKLLAGYYNGISIFERNNGQWAFQKKMEHIYGSCNQLLLEEEHTLWINIPNYGIIRTLLSDSLEPQDRIFFPSNDFTGTDPFIYREGNAILVKTDQHSFKYVAETKRFERSEQSILPPENTGILYRHQQALLIHPDYAFYPAYNGFALHYLHHRKSKDSFAHSLVLRKLEAYNNQERILVPIGSEVKYRLHNLRIEYIVPNQEVMEYQYKLNDAEDWTSNGKNTSLDLLGLDYGEYILTVRAHLEDGIVENTIARFHIAPPFHRSWYALVLYLLLLLTVVSLIRYRVILSLKRQKKKMLLKEQKSLRIQAEKHKQELMMIEQQRLKDEYEQLKLQLKNKTIELASKARDNEEKNRLLLSVKESFEKARKTPSSSSIKWNEIQRMLDTYINIEDKTFEIQMDELHQDFFRKLKESFPGLSNNDLRLCAYLKIGLNSKEIADILNIQPSSSYISRSRLRKKLDLKPEENLYDFLNSI